MNPKLIMSFFGIFIVGTLLACLMSGRWLLNGEVNIINALASFQHVGISVGGGVQMASATSNFFAAVGTAFTWDYPYLDNEWATLIKIPLWLISAGVAWGLIQVFVTIISGAISLVKSFV